MARTFDELVNIASLQYYKVSNTTWYSRNITSGDYFDDDAAVGDILYFIVGNGGTNNRPTHNLRVNVGTALVADSITLVWEFYHKDNTWNPLTITSDPTNNFTVTGLNTITFDVPDGWTSIRTHDLSGTSKPTSAYMMIVRARISAVTSLTEGGANTTNAIQTNNWTITIPNGDSVVPLDLYNDDVAGSWGVITQQDVRNYVCTANISLVSGGSFTIANWIRWQTGTEDKWRTFFKTGDLTLGKKDGSDLNEGSSFIYYNIIGRSADSVAGVSLNWTGIFNCYNSYFWKRGSSENPSWAGESNMYNSIFESQGALTRWYWPSSATGGTIENCTFSHPNNTASYGIFLYASKLNISNMIIGKGYGYYINANNVFLSNIYFKSGKKGFIWNFSTTGSGFRDCDYEDDIAVHFSDAHTGLLLVQNTITISPIDIDGVAITDVYVKIIDSQSNVLYDDIWVGDLVVNIWRKTNVASGSVVTDFNPMEIWISKPGYRTYYTKMTIDNVSKNITTTLTQKNTEAYYLLLKKK